ncbi:MAG: PIN domain-containing protein [Elusimicrobiota bacterium]|jgi:predicted nucleic acid-binding protein|nr:PIN domain-containing protein [Elusimicrobiota bacterium]
MKIYLDNCCYSRPFDDQNQERIHLESEAILTILKRCKLDIYKIIGSDILDFEMNKLKNLDKKEKIKNLYQIVEEKIKYTNEILEYAKKIKKQSLIRSLDSLHIACAEKQNIDIFLTTDDKLKNICKKLKLKIKVMNPIEFIMEVNYE